MPAADWTTVEAQPAGPTLCLHGVWRLADLPAIEAALQAATLQPVVAVDATRLMQLDSAAALVLLRSLQVHCADFAALRWVGFDDARGRILAQVRAHVEAATAPAAAAAEGIVAHIGRVTLVVTALLLGHLRFLGQAVVAAGDLLRGRQALRWRELSAQVQQAGLAAIPVVALVTMLIGVVFTYLLGLQASRYGASIFVVDGVAIGSAREFAPIIVAIVVAGRSGAAFTAQLGSMRLTEEIDAIQTLGLSPQQVLVLPRVLALMLTLPLLVFVGDVMSLVGSMLIAGPMLGIGVPAFLDRLREALDLKHVLIGLGKAPIFAGVIAIIGTRMGMTVGRDARAVGAATTSTVVQSIVAVILLDALFAVLMQALGW